MGDFLTAVSSVSLRPKSKVQDLAVEDPPLRKSEQQAIRISPKTVDEVLEFIRSSPDEEPIISLLSFLNKKSKGDAGFHIKIPSPSSAKVINELINTTLSDFWDSNDRFNSSILDCLRSVAGIGAILARLRLLTSRYGSTKQGGKGPEATKPLADIISVFSQLLHVDGLAKDLLIDIEYLVENATKRTLLWKEFLSSVGTGRIISAVAEAEDTVKSAGGTHKPSWLSDGSKYCAWLGRNVCTLMNDNGNDEIAWKATAQLCSKALSIGYSGE